MKIIEEITYPDPNNTNPSTGNTVDLREAPVGISSNDGRNKLRNAEGSHESNGGTLHEEETMRTSNEDESLRDDGDLEVHDHMKLRIMRIDVASTVAVGQGDTKLVLEERGFHNDDDEDDAKNMKSVSGVTIGEGMRTWTGSTRDHNQRHRRKSLPSPNYLESSRARRDQRRGS